VTDVHTENSPALSTLPSGIGADRFTGVFPSASGQTAEVAKALSVCPLVVGQAHGILTGKSSPSWPEFGSAFFRAFHPQVCTVDTEYFEWPLPRVAALRNPARSRNLVRRLKTAAQYQVEMRETPAELAVIGHSNGNVLTFQGCRELIREGIAIKVMILIAPALPTRAASREISGWLASGMLGSAVLVRPMRDRVIGAAGRSWRTKIVVWPWGSLGADGWAVDEFPEFTELNIRTIDLPDMGHSDPVSPQNRRWLYEAIIAPALGLSPWGDLNPETQEVAA